MKPHLLTASSPLAEGYSHIALCGVGVKPVLSNLRGVCPRCLKSEAPGYGFIYKLWMGGCGRKLERVENERN